MSTRTSSAVELDGVFDVEAAETLGRRIGEVKPGGALLVDFRRVRDFHDVGLARLARTILGSRQSVELDVRGLREHQHRMLRYFGVELARDRLTGDGALP
jgi:hypothetical protein